VVITNYLRIIDDFKSVCNGGISKF